MTEKTMLHFQRGTELDTLTNFAAIKVEITVATTAATLRKELHGEMLKSDRFLNVHGFPLSNSTDVETNTLLKDLVVPLSKNSSGESDSSPAQPKGSGMLQ
jgi:polyisoprenoid-binding protein YceI